MESVYLMVATTADKTSKLVGNMRIESQKDFIKNFSLCEKGNILANLVKGESFSSCFFYRG